MSRQDLGRIVNDGLDRLLTDVYEAEGITSGDISPEQVLEWDKNVSNILDIFTTLITQNEDPVKK